MSLRLIFVSAVSVATLTACATRQENPIYKYSSAYKASSPVQTVSATPQADSPIVPVIYDNYADANAYVVPASASTGQTSRIVNECRMSGGLETCRAVQLSGSVTPSTNPQLAAQTTLSQDDYLIAASQTAPNTGSLTQVDGECVQAGAVVPCYPVEIPITTAATISEPYYAQAEVIMAGAQENSVPATTASDSYYHGNLDGTPGYYAVQNTQDYVAADTIDLPASSQNSVIAATSAQNGQFADEFFVSDGAMLHHVTEGDTLYSLARKTCTSVSEIQAMNGIGGDFSIRLGDNIRLPASRC